MSEVTPDKAANLDSQTFLTALATNAAVLAVELTAFIFLKHRLSRIYEPRAYLPPPDKRAVVLPYGPWKWLLAIVAIPTKDIFHKNGMDAYMFLRFLRLLIILFACTTLITWLILLPVDAADLKGANFSDGLAKLSWGNIPDGANKRYAAHIIVIWMSTFFTFYLVRLELLHYAAMRQAFLVSKSHSHQAQARTVLITNIPPEMCDEKELRLWASFVPGGIQNIWIYRDTTALNKAHTARLKACKKLEGASAKLIRKVVKAKKAADTAEEKARKREEKARKKEEKALKKAGGMKNQDMEKPMVEGQIEQRQSADTYGTTRPLQPRTTTGQLLDVEAGNFSRSPSADYEGNANASDVVVASETPETLLEKYVPPPKRPHHRLGFLGLLGKKVDTIEWCKEEIARLNTEIKTLRGELEKGETKPMGSAFIQCNMQLGAHVLAQCVSYHVPLMMQDKWIEVAPKDVIWDNIDDGAYETRFRYVTSWLASIILIVIWFAPVAFVGTLSNVAALCEKVSWLCWIRNAPVPVPGIIQGILPPLFLAILFAILPLLLKGLAWYENIPRWSLLSMSVYKRYFMFLIVHGFLVVTLSSGVASTASEIVDDPKKAVSDLASNLPNASIFFLTWTLTQGLTGAGSALLQVGVLLMHFVKRWFLGRTPRQAYGVTFLMPKADFGLVLPRISLLATIALAYSVLSPIINGLATVAFLLFFFAWKFLLTWVFDQPEESETGGQYFPLAINFLFAGLYIEHFCLAVLFFLKISEGISFIAMGLLMILLMGITVAVQLLFQRSFDPITKFLPMSLATKKMKERIEHEKILHASHPLGSRRHQHHESGRENDTEEEEIDLFSRDRLRSVVRKRIQAPVQKLAAKVEEEVAKTVMPKEEIEKEREKEEKEDEKKEKEKKDKETHDDEPRASTSAHEVRPTTEGYLPAHDRDDTLVDGERTKPQSKSKSKSRSPPASRRSSTSSQNILEPLPDIAPAAAALTNPSNPNDDDDDDKDFDPHGFNHPSTYTSQPWIWLPKDGLGVSEVLVREFVSAGVDASDVGASMDRKGVVEVVRNPPDEEWAGGHDA